MRLRILLTSFLLCLMLGAADAAPRARDFAAVCDSLRIRLIERMGVDQELKMSRVRVRGNSLDLHFSAELSYYPWHEEDVEWFRNQIVKEWQGVASSYNLGNIYTNRYELSQLILPYLHNSGLPSGYERAIGDPRDEDPGTVRQIGARRFRKGLDGRHIALWQSHGRYYNEDQDIWMWQRAQVHRTVEDMYTQSYVLPFLMPMLENAGAYLMTPRERDTQWREIICDNDPSFEGKREGRLRKSGKYSEKGSWSDAGSGFADFKEAYTFSDLPFSAGSARSAECSGTKATASAVWTAEIEERGSYAVYVSYKTLDNSNPAARYSVSHMGGVSEFSVNQKRGGATWIYLGTFEFSPESGARVTLDNRGEAGMCVTADAVKIGGGMGKLERGGRTSGVPAFAEGAHYWMQWAGADSSITRNWETDYTNDFASRGLWTMMMKEQKEIPFDLSFAFHSDAGITPNDSIVGTLAIYTLRSDGEREFSDGRDRIISRLLCDYVQTQVVEDIRADFNPEWTRRGLWDRSYSESRTTGVPAMILELLSHQNFADMKYGLDPAFRFTVSRAVYKGILKTLSDYYDTPYVVQPLPVRAFSAKLVEGGRLRLEWEARSDKLEPTAAASGYTVYTRIDGGAFDKGVETTDNHLELRLEPGHIYSFKVEAWNEGGRSFPSEILSAGIAPSSDAREVLVVNNFDRVSAPSWIDTPDYAGFTARKDSGVPYINDISYIGENYEFNRHAEYIDDDYPGFGASHSDRACEIIAGNSFDYPYVHGKLLLELGYSFSSMSAEAFCKGGAQADAIDLICGKQGGEKYPVYSEELKAALREFSQKGGGILISGSNIASDSSAADEAFCSELFGFKLANAFGSPSGMLEDMPFSNELNSRIYCVEHPDGLKPTGIRAKVWLRYPDARYGAAVKFNSGHHKSVSIGVPIETLLSEDDRKEVLEDALNYLL